MTIKKSRYKLYWLIAIFTPLLSFTLPDILFISSLFVEVVVERLGMKTDALRIEFEHFYYAILAFESLFIALQAFASIKVLTSNKKARLMKTLVLIVLFLVVLYSFYRNVINYWELVNDWIAAITGGV